MTGLRGDREQISSFIEALFTYADEGTFISLRSFDQFDRDKAPVIIESAKINGHAGKLADHAFDVAQRSADHARSTVFAPPVCTFKARWGAKGTDLANGVALSIELDDAPLAARTRMEGLLGPATLVVASGSEWTDPATGEVEPKLHLHWRLSEPTRDDAEHAKLRAARTAAALLVGGDPTGKPIVHPYRWPGSWNTKAAPRMCRIVARSQAAEIHLTEALDTLQATVEAAGLASVNVAVSSDPHAAATRIRSAMAAIPNAGTEVHYDFWITLGYAVCNAVGPGGFDIWDEWSRKSDKYDAGETESAWGRIVAAISGTDAPRKVGAGTIIMHAKAAGWGKPAEQPEGKAGAAPEDAGSDEARIAELAAMSALDYDRLRVAEAGRMGCRVTTLDDAVQRARNASDPPRYSDPEDIRPPEFTDESLALRFAALHADRLRYVAGWGRWLIWDGTVWRFDETMKAFDYARQVCRHASAECNDDRVASGIASAKTVAAVERLAKADRRHAATVGQWDADPWLLNTPGGVVDLRTGDVRAATPGDYMTKITAVAPGGVCPRWHAFLAEITGEDGELTDFMMRVMGYALTGVTREHAMFFGYGTGANGKGTFLNTMTGIFGSYATVAPMETFTATTSDRHPADLAMLRGARLVAAQETEEGKRWAESKIKALTGGDPITARFMRQDFFTFVPLFKLFIAGNHKPGLRGVDEAMRRRLNMLPFTVTIPADKRDPELAEKLKEEWPGILKCTIEACRHWQRIGLKPPAAVTAATDEYFETEDALERWIGECCEKMSGPVPTESSKLFASWKRWAESAGEHPGSQKRFSQALQSKGYEPKRLTGGKSGFDGIRFPVPRPRVETPEERE